MEQDGQKKTLLPLIVGPEHWEPDVEGRRFIPRFAWRWARRINVAGPSPQWPSCASPCSRLRRDDLDDLSGFLTVARENRLLREVVSIPISPTATARFRPPTARVRAFVRRSARSAWRLAGAKVLLDLLSAAPSPPLPPLARRVLAALVVCALSRPAPSAASTPVGPRASSGDRDADGVPDDEERVLGLDPDVPNVRALALRHGGARRARGELEANALVVATPRGARPVSAAGDGWVFARGYGLEVEPVSTRGWRRRSLRARCPPLGGGHGARPSSTAGS